MPPGESVTVEQLLKRYCELGDFLGVEAYRYVLEHGRDWEPSPLPDNYGRMRPRDCFLNATVLAHMHPALRYVEGFAMHPATPFPIHHAWVVDGEDRVIDPTWEQPEDCLYRGVVFSLEHIWRLGRTGMALYNACKGRDGDK
ncbi:hypothetical protein [Caudovirales GX15bay]|nr:hypothetical protein [Caudovirales GX15bay]